MEEDSGNTSPTSADVAEQMGITSEEPPADEPLALVKKKIKIEPGLEDEEPVDFGEALKDEDKPSSVLQKVTMAQTSSLPLFTTGSSSGLLYTTGNGVTTVPQLVDLIPTAVNGKTVRPFKAYNANRELLGGFAASSGISTYPAVPIALSGPAGAAVPLSVPTVVTTGSLAAVQTSLANSTAHLMTLATEADKLLQKTKDPNHVNGHVKLESGSADEAMTPGSTSGGSDSGSAGDLLEETILKIKKRAGLATKTDEQKPPIPIAPAPSHSNSNKKSKKSRNANSQLPDQMKDGHYWERRRKNNEAAKRSRDARRAKEDQIAIRAALLEQENMRLRIEVAALKEETVKLRAMLYNKK